MPSLRRICILGLGLALGRPTLTLAQNGVPPLPATPRRPVSSEYHGVTVMEDYRWLENFDDSAVRAWSDSQNAHTRAFIPPAAIRHASERRIPRHLLNG